MSTPRPQYLLFTEALRSTRGGRMWRFLLLEMGTNHSTSASDIEPQGSHARTELLALVRGLEAMGQPGDVKLVTASSYILRGVTRGIAAWSAQGWHWERFGRRVPVRDADLWQRVARTLEFHKLDCHAWTRPERITEQASVVLPRQADTSEEREAAARQAGPAIRIGRQARPARVRRKVLADSARQTITGVRSSFESLVGQPLVSAG